MPHGYHQRILHVNLTTGEMNVEQPDERFYRKYLGGSAMGLYYLLKGMPAGVDPLAPENVLTFCLSVITGAPISGQSRMTASARSPLTNCVGDAQCGGFFPAELKFAGYDAIVLRGKAPKPVYLWINDGRAELRDASHLWGRVTGEVDHILKQELGDERIQVLQVGPAGERGVRFAAIMNMSNRANGRTGMGAVMGSKNLKAVAVRGTQKPSLADKTALNRLARWGAERLPASDIAGLAKYGTAETTGQQQVVGGLPSYNFTSGVFEGWEALNGPTMYDTILRGAATGEQDRLGRDTCFACAVRCKRVVEHKEAPYPLNPQYGGPEYESTSTLGCYCGVGDLVAVAKAAELCNMYGMDTISCGATIAWAMECFEAGVLSRQDTGGLELRYGNAEALVQLTEMIGRRQGFGDVLAEGSARAAARLGKGQQFLITTKGQEAPAHMPQVKRTLALIYAANPFGADHQSHEHDPAYAPYPVRMAQLGQREALLTSQAIWLCVGCETCGTRCPNQICVGRLNDALKAMAVEAGAPVGQRDVYQFHVAFLNSIRRFGRVHEVTMLVEYKLRAGNLLADLDLGLKLLLAGKLPALPRLIRGRQQIAQLFDRLRD